MDTTSTRTTPPKDEGLFGPHSVAWRVHAHPSGLVGGLRALLIQALNPLAMAGVAEHSAYKNDPWGRLVATSNYIAATTYGDTETALAAAARVRAVHKHVRGVDPFTGRRYSAEDPELLLWIHAVEVHSFIAGYRSFGPGLTRGDTDRYVAEMVTAGELVGLHRYEIPSDHGSLCDYLTAQELVASPAARAALRFILFPPVVWPGGRYPNVPAGRLLEVPGRVGWAVPSAAAVALLPARARRAYRLPNLRPMLPALKVVFGGFARALQAIAEPPPGVLLARARGAA